MFPVPSKNDRTEVTLSWAHLHVHIPIEISCDCTELWTHREHNIDAISDSDSGSDSVPAQYVIMLSVYSWCQACFTAYCPWSALNTEISVSSSPFLRWSEHINSVMVFFISFSFTPFLRKGVVFLLQPGSSAQIKAKVVSIDNLLMLN